MRVLGDEGVDVVGLDVLASPYTTIVGSVADRGCVRRCMRRGRCRAARRHAAQAARRLAPPRGLRAHQHQRHADAARGGGRGRACRASSSPARRARSAARSCRRRARRRRGSPRTSRPVPRNIYGATKVAAEDLCELVHRDHGLPCLDPAHVALLPGGRRPRRRARGLRGPEREGQRAAVPPRRPRGRRERAPAARWSARPQLGFGRYIISATTPFEPRAIAELRADAPAVVRRHVPGYEEVYAQRGWTMFDSLERVYDNARAREELGWAPRYDFAARDRARSRRARTRAASWRGRSARRATTRSRPGRTRLANG